MHNHILRAAAMARITDQDESSSTRSVSEVRIEALAVSSRRRKSNSERGKEFRAKRRHHEIALLEMINSLRQDVRDLRFLRDLRGEAALVTKSSLEGSLVRLVREYFSLFARGRPTDARTPTDHALISKQERFLAQTTVPWLNFGGGAGTAALLDQWQRYTNYHASFRIEVASVSVQGSSETPTIAVCSHLCVTLSRDTFKHIFPHVADDNELIDRHVGRQVKYCGVNHFQFSEDGNRITVYESNVDFVSALLAAGIGLADVAVLMNQARIVDQCLLGEEPHTPRPTEHRNATEESVSKRPRQVTMEYLLNRDHDTV